MKFTKLYFFQICGKENKATEVYVSKMLNVHINTLHYRILRMEELFGLDFKNYYMLNACISNFGLIYSSKPKQEVTL